MKPARDRLTLAASRIGDWRRLRPSPYTACDPQDARIQGELLPTSVFGQQHHVPGPERGAGPGREGRGLAAGGERGTRAAPGGQVPGHGDWDSCAVVLVLEATAATEVGAQTSRPVRGLADEPMSFG